MRRGERGSQVVYMGETTKTQRDEGTGEDTEQGVRFLKPIPCSTLARSMACPRPWRSRPDASSPPLPGPEPIAHAEAFFAATGADIRHGGAQAFYTVTADHIGMPPLAAFRDAESYYATLGHV